MYLILSFVNSLNIYIPEQLYELRKMTVAKLICNNAEEVDRIQPAAFLLIGNGYGLHVINTCITIQNSVLFPYKTTVVCFL